MTVIEYSSENLSFKDLTAAVGKDDMTVFRLTDVKIEGSEDDMLRFSKKLRGHPSLQSFELISVSVVDAAVDLDQVISTLLVTVPFLQKLQLENTSLGANAIATIGYSSSLTQLAITKSNLTDDDAKGIAGAVAQNKTIEKIDVSGNSLSDGACLAFAAALDKNTSITDLRLDDNGNISGANRAKIELKLAQKAGGVPQAA